MWIEVGHWECRGLLVEVGEGGRGYEEGARLGEVGRGLTGAE